jgi:hypothetical protein
LTTLINSLESTLSVAKTTSRTTLNASLGVYAVATDNIKKTADKITATFNGFVEKGTEVEPKLKQQVAKLTDKLITLDDIKVKAQSLSARITGVNGKQLDELDAKLENMTILLAEKR